MARNCLEATAKTMARNGEDMFRFRSGSGDFRRVLGRLLGTLIVLGIVGVSRPYVAAAQTCGTDYTIKEGETLAQIAARVYGNPTQWTIIFYANQDRLGTSESLLVPGFTLR